MEAQRNTTQWLLKTASPDDIFNFPLYEAPLCLDLRPKSAFDRLTIIGARNIPLPVVDAKVAHVASLLSEELRENCPDTLRRVIVYGDGPEIGSVVAAVLSPALAAAVGTVRHPPAQAELMLLVQGFAAFSTAYPFLCAPGDSADAGIQQIAYPSLVTRQPRPLFLGSSFQLSTSATITNLKISHIVNAAVECPCVFPEQVTYLALGLVDSNTQPLDEAIPKALSFITAAMAQPDAVVAVHCHQGRSRSAAIVIAWLMHATGGSYEEALAIVKAARPTVDPNPGFVRQLQSLKLERSNRIV
eukprot:TRINITY_DN3372_c0_g1_i6.p1 TRINITY_DN3372_c0_g1~~TRINITY_DN3372_c0_g1_i6.p1  ORF type:complete len:301 (+),score=55.29 TRINITY_DN3372_c0_g1_i6:1-903(+)